MIGDALEPIAKQAVDSVVDGHCDILLTTIGGFQSDAEAVHLRDMLWYASDKGVVVQFVPLTKPQEKG